MRIPRLRRQQLLLQASLCAIVVRISLRIASLPTAVRVAAAMAALCPAPAGNRACVAAARLATYRWSHATCLYRALTAYALISRRHGVSVHLGVTPVPFAAHAWLTAPGLRSTPPRFVPLWSTEYRTPSTEHER